MYKGNGCRIYVNIMTGEICRQFRFLTWNYRIGHFVHLVGWESNREKRVDGWYRYFSRCEFHFIWEHEYLVLHPSSNISIVRVFEKPSQSNPSLSPLHISTNPFLSITFNKDDNIQVVARPSYSIKIRKI